MRSRVTAVTAVPVGTRHPVAVEVREVMVETVVRAEALLQAKAGTEAREETVVGLVMILRQVVLPGNLEAQEEPGVTACQAPEGTEEMVVTH
jgi:hypothetical protein